MTDIGGKYAQGLSGFPTPDAAGDTGAYLLFLFGDNPAIAQLLLGALEPLIYPYNWYLWGDMSTDDAAEYLKTVVQQAPYNLVDLNIQAPFWDEDSGDDAAAEAPRDEQTWYGTWDGETYTETLAYVFLTNFLSTLVSAQAAIKFLTIPRAFRVAIRQNPHGANLLLFLDGGLYKVINGYSPVDKVVEFLIASPGTELMLVVDNTHDPDSTPNSDGKYVVDVLRKRLAADEVTPTNVRYYGSTPVYQTTMDDGATWVSQPSADPRYSPTSYFPPLIHYDNIECDTAARMTAALHDAITLMCNVADAAQAVTGLLELILLPSGLVGWLLDLFFTVCNWIIDNGQDTILAAFTDAVYHSIECALYCAIEPDGSITQVKLDAAWEKIKAAHAGTVATVIDEVRFLFTDAIFSNAGVARSETGDCADCECPWVWEWDFTISDQGWEVYGGYGHYESGVGFQSDPVSTSYSLIMVNSQAITFTSQEVQLTVGYNVDPTGDGSKALGYGSHLGGSFTSAWIFTPIATPNPNTYDRVRSEDWVDALYINPSGGNSSIQATVMSLQMHGTGIVPAFTGGHQVS